jgi:hypothetical protein
MAMLVIVRAALPELISVTAWLALFVARTCVAKAKLAGDKLTIGAIGAAICVLVGDFAGRWARPIADLPTALLLGISCAREFDTASAANTKAPKETNVPKRVESNLTLFSARPFCQVTPLELSAAHH